MTNIILIFIVLLIGHQQVIPVSVAISATEFKQDVFKAIEIVQIINRDDTNEAFAVQMKTIVNTLQEIVSRLSNTYYRRSMNIIRGAPSIVPTNVDAGQQSISDVAASTLNVLGVILRDVSSLVSSVREILKALEVQIDSCLSLVCAIRDHINGLIDPDKLNEIKVKTAADLLKVICQVEDMDDKYWWTDGIIPIEAARNLAAEVRAIIIIHRGKNNIAFDAIDADIKVINDTLQQYDSNSFRFEVDVRMVPKTIPICVSVRLVCAIIENLQTCTNADELHKTQMNTAAEILKNLIETVNMQSESATVNADIIKFSLQEVIQIVGRIDAGAKILVDVVAVTVEVISVILEDVGTSKTHLIFTQNSPGIMLKLSIILIGALHDYFEGGSADELYEIRNKTAVYFLKAIDEVLVIKYKIETVTVTKELFEKANKIVVVNVSKRKIAVDAIAVHAQVIRTILSDKRFLSKNEGVIIRMRAHVISSIIKNLHTCISVVQLHKILAKTAVKFLGEVNTFYKMNAPPYTIFQTGSLLFMVMQVNKIVDMIDTAHNLKEIKANLENLISEIDIEWNSSTIKNASIIDQIGTHIAQAISNIEDATNSAK